VVHLLLLPPANFFSLSSSSVYFSTPSWILKLKAFPNTCHIFPHANFLSLSRVPILFFHHFLDIKIASVPSSTLRIYFSHSCASIHFSTTSRILKFKALHVPPYIFPRVFSEFRFYGIPYVFRGITQNSVLRNSKNSVTFWCHEIPHDLILISFSIAKTVS
jgi:hypothetical protein